MLDVILYNVDLIKDRGSMLDVILSNVDLIKDRGPICITKLTSPAS